MFADIARIFQDIGILLRELKEMIYYFHSTISAMIPDKLLF